jgi:hypothetical protein
MTTKTRRAFPDEFKAETVTLLESGGRPLTQIAAGTESTTPWASCGGKKPPGEIASKICGTEASIQNE